VNAVSVLVFTVMMALLSACGYQFQVQGRGPTIGGSQGPPPTAASPKIAIPVFTNRSLEPNLETKYTSYMQYEFGAGSGAQVVRDKDEADMVLAGQIIAISIPTLAFTLQGTQESRVTVFAAVTLEDRKTGKLLWRQNVSASSEYFVTSDLQFNRVLQTRALEQAGRLIAQDVAMRFLDHLESGALERARGSKEGFVPEKPKPGQLPPATGPKGMFQP
jgi:outer membrane lipopolysaccharide assembly protein LptE/RlpB